MGNPILLQACLRLDKQEIPEELTLGKEGKFFKEGHRLYQLDVPMDLRDSEWNFYGRIIIREYTIGKNRTQGTYVLVKEFSEQERETITKAYVSDEEVKEVL